jgi:hypothetical protein
MLSLGTYKQGTSLLAKKMAQPSLSLVSTLPGVYFG